MDIVIVPVGKIDKKDIEPLIAGMGNIFRRQVIIREEMPAPDDAVNKKRGKYSGERMINALIENKEYSIYKRTLGVVDHDLYAPDMNFIFGLAGEKAAIISITRLRQQFYGLSENTDRFNQRTLTEAVHELGHTYGLGHCNNSRCVMCFSNNPVDTDRKGAEFCTRCRYRIYVV